MYPPRVANSSTFQITEDTHLTSLTALTRDGAAPEAGQAGHAAALSGQVHGDGRGV